MSNSILFSILQSFSYFFPSQDMSVESQEDAMIRLIAKADDFQKHAGRLSQVARQSAAISGDTKSKGN